MKKQEPQRQGESRQAIESLTALLQRQESVELLYVGVSREYMRYAASLGEKVVFGELMQTGSIGLLAYKKLQDIYHDQDSTYAERCFSGQALDCAPVDILEQHNAPVSRAVSAAEECYSNHINRMRLKLEVILDHGGEKKVLDEEGQVVQVDYVSPRNMQNVAAVMVKIIQAQPQLAAQCATLFLGDAMEQDFVRLHPGAPTHVCSFLQLEKHGDQYRPVSYELRT
jgi:hypothetical protein